MVIPKILVSLTSGRGLSPIYRTGLVTDLLLMFITKDFLSFSREVVESGDYTLDVESGDYTLDVESGDYTLDVESGDYTLDVESGDYTLDVESVCYTVSMSQQ